MSAAETVRLEDLFDENGELRISEYEDGWIGFRRRGDGQYSYVNTRRDDDDWPGEIVFGPRAVRQTVERHVREGPA